MPRPMPGGSEAKLLRDQSLPVVRRLTSSRPSSALALDNSRISIRSTHCSAGVHVPEALEVDGDGPGE